MTLFYCAHWQSYVSGTLRLGKIDVTEAQCMIMIIHLISAVFGPGIWMAKVWTLLDLSMGDASRRNIANFGGFHDSEMCSNSNEIVPTLRKWHFFFFFYKYFEVFLIVGRRWIIYDDVTMTNQWIFLVFHWSYFVKIANKSYTKNI